MEPKNPLEKPRNEKEAAEELKNKWRQVFAESSDREGLHHKVFELVENLREVYPELNLKNYRLYHVLSFSTVAEKDEPNIKSLDLPGGEFEKFIRSL